MDGVISDHQFEIDVGTKNKHYPSLDGLMNWKDRMKCIVAVEFNNSHRYEQ